MTKLLYQACFALLALLATSPLYAQPFQGLPSPGGPVVSPYLSLNNGGDFGNGVSNYFTLVLPQIQQQQQQQSLQRQQYQINQLQRQERANSFSANRGGNPIQSPQIRSTGHPTSFNNYSHYYLFQPGRRL